MVALLRGGHGVVPCGDTTRQVGDEALVLVTGGAEDDVRRQLVGRAMGLLRMHARPTSGLPSLAVTLSDGTGTVVAVWTGRRAIGGITLGRRLLLDGVPRRVGDRLEFVDPAYTLLSR